MVADNYAGAVVYPEFLTDDMKLTLANARSASSYGAVVVTYAKAEEILIEGGHITGSVVRCNPSGSVNLCCWLIIAPVLNYRQ